jgi:hypothetical protein
LINHTIANRPHPAPTSNAAIATSPWLKVVV